MTIKGLIASISLKLRVNAIEGLLWLPRNWSRWNSTLPYPEVASDWYSFRKHKWRGYDIGAGVGQYANELRRRGYDIVEVEPDKRYTDFPKRVEDLTEERDFAYMVNVLHHAQDPVELLTSVKGVAKVLIVSEINKDNPIVRFGIKWRLPWENIDAHLNEMELRVLLTKAGWRIPKVEKAGLLGIPRVYNWFLCTRP